MNKKPQSPAHRSLNGLALPAWAAAALLCGLVGQATAGRAPAASDLAVQLQAPSTVNISVATPYTVTVNNQGPQNSGDIEVRVNFPLSNTSPQVFILGQVTGLDSRCRLSANSLLCQLPNLRKNQATSFTYHYTAPVSTKPLQMTATVSAATADPVPGNNSATVLPDLVYPSRPITESAINVRACTGTGLTSFYECEQFPSSQMGFSAVLKNNQSVEFAQPGYSGSWSQNTAKTSLAMMLYEDQGQGPVAVASFAGWAVNGSRCFHGLATHLQSSTHVSPYAVCLP